MKGNRMFFSLFQIQFIAVWAMVFFVFPFLFALYLNGMVEMLGLACLLVLFGFLKLMVSHRRYKNESKDDFSGDSFLNPLGFVELHMGGLANSKREFFAVSSWVIVEASFYGHDFVLFDTWVLSPEKLKKKLGDAVEVRKLPLSLHIFMAYLKWKYGKGCFGKKSYRYIVHVGRLTGEQLEFLEGMYMRRFLQGDVKWGEVV